MLRCALFTYIKTVMGSMKKEFSFLVIPVLNGYCKYIDEFSLYRINIERKKAK